MIIKKIDLNKILSKNEFHQLEHDLSKLIFENIILKDKNDIYKYKYNYNINNLQNLLKLFKEKTNTDYSYLKKIYKMYDHFHNENNAYLKNLIFDIFYYSYHKFTENIITTLFKIEDINK